MRNHLAATAIVSVAALMGGVARAQTPTTIQWSGYTWTVRTGGTGSPGTDTWANNVSVDPQGRLHLFLSKVNGQWYSAEIVSTNKFGYGTYQFQTDGNAAGTGVDVLDPNVVLGVFSYPTPDVGPDGTNEIDMELSKFGYPSNNNLNYTVYPAQARPNCPYNTGQRACFESFPFSFNGNGVWSTHRYIRTSSTILFQSTFGHYNNNPYPIGSDFNFAPSPTQYPLSTAPMPVHINLYSVASPTWNNPGPSNGQNVEVVLDNFTFTAGPS